jgi:hypothetical protein
MGDPHVVGAPFEPHEQVAGGEALGHALAPLDGDDGAREIGVEVEVVELGGDVADGAEPAAARLRRRAAAGARGR